MEVRKGYAFILRIVCICYTRHNKNVKYKFIKTLVPYKKSFYLCTRFSKEAFGV